MHTDVSIFLSTGFKYFHLLVHVVQNSDYIMYI